MPSQPLAGDTATRRVASPLRPVASRVPGAGGPSSVSLSACASVNGAGGAVARPLTTPAATRAAMAAAEPAVRTHMAGHPSLGPMFANLADGTGAGAKAAGGLRPTTAGRAL